MVNNIKQEINTLFDRYGLLINTPNGNDINHNIGPDEVIFDMSYLLKLMKAKKVFDNAKLYEKEVELWTNIYGLVNYFLLNIDKDPIELNKSILELPEASYGDSFSLYSRYNYKYKYDTTTDNFINTNSPTDREKLKKLFELKDSTETLLRNKIIEDISDIVPGILTSVWGVSNAVYVIGYFLSRYF